MCSFNSFPETFYFWIIINQAYTLFFLMKIMVLPEQAEYFNFSAVFRLKIFLRIFLDYNVGNFWFRMYLVSG